MATPRSVDDVRAVVRVAAMLGLRVAPQSTGHGADAVSPSDMSESVLVRMHELTGVRVDPVLGTAQVVGGTVWSDVLAAVAPHGYTAMHGSAGDVAVCGYLLGGGLSFYGRRHGLASSTVLSMEVVTADGTLRHASPTSHPDLFWALSGGGGNFGIVVAVDIALLPVADVYAGMLLWDLERAPDVTRAWLEWTQTAPEDVTTSLRVMRFPPLPELPPFLSGRSIVVIDGAVLGDDETAREILAPLRRLAPEIDTFGRIPSPELIWMHMDPPAPTPTVGDHLLLGPLSHAAVDALMAVAGPGVDTPLMFAELRHLGGALARPADAALAAVNGEFALLAVAVVADGPDHLDRYRAVTTAVADRLRPWSTGSLFPNFHGAPDSTRNCFDDDTLARLNGIREAVDPTGMFVAAHPLPRPTPRPIGSDTGKLR